jgi:hypothetical protein
LTDFHYVSNRHPFPRFAEPNPRPKYSGAVLSEP